MKKWFLFVLLMPLQLQAWTLPGVGTYQFDKVANNVYVMHGPLQLPNKKNLGFMNNPAVIVGDKGLIVVDPGSTYQVGKHVLSEIKKVSKLPIVAVFNSHIHGDHWLANQAVKEAYPKAKIYGHKEMIKQANDAAGLHWIDMMMRLTEGASKGTKVVAPKHTSKHQDKYSFAGQNFVIHSFKRSHTNTDIMIEHVESNTLFMGDNGFNKRMGRFDNSSSMYGTIEVLEYLTKNKFKTYVPGHGQSGDYKTAVKPFLDYLLILRKVVKAGFEKELENYEIKSAAKKKLKAYHDWAGFEENFGRHVSKMYLEVEAHEL